MDEFLSEEVKVYKAREGLDKFRSASDNQGVVADWSGLTMLQSIRDGITEIGAPPETYIIDRSASRRWILRHNSENIILYVLSSSNNKFPLEALVQIAVNRTSGIFPHKKAEGPGDVFVAYQTDSYRDLIWIYRNMCFHLEQRNSSENESGKLAFNSMALAREIQKYAEAHLVQNVQSHYPRIARIVVAPEKVHAGDDFTVTLKMEGDTDAGHYGMDFDRSDNLELESIDEGLSIRLQALAPGKGEVRFRVYDARTLLMTQKTVQIDVREKGK